MEGTLLKWTNYYNGWQPRYFVLNEKGILSYYKSSELIHEGCKGSCLILACEVKAHSNDFLRFDLIIPGEQFFSLKAKSQPERQRWLVALGTHKSRGTKSDATIISEQTTPQLELVCHLGTIDHELKLKVQELRLYETVLMQRIDAVKCLANHRPTPNVKELDKTTSMLIVTCDGFIQTLDECVQLATGDARQSSLNSSLNIDGTTTTKGKFSPNDFHSIKNTTTTILPKQIIYQTFFSKLRQTFFQLNCLSFNEIPFEQFISTCEEYVHLIEKLNSKTFVSLRTNVDDNISKLKMKLRLDPDKCRTLFSLINNEMSNQMIKDKTSAIFSLIAIQRIVNFLGYFLIEFGQGETTVENALNKSYGQTLKPFHEWINRELFAVAFRSVPSNEDFLRSLLIHPNDAHQILFERQIMNEMIEHGTNIIILLQKIHQFYQEHQLYSDEILS